MTASRSTRFRAGVASAAVLLVLLPFTRRADCAESSLRSELELFSQVLFTLQQNHVVKPDDRALIRAAIDGMLQSLGPGSTFIPDTPDPASTAPELAGIGLSIESGRGAGVIEHIVEGGPASRAGLRTGERVVSVNGVRLPRSSDQVRDLLRGEPGTSVMLVIDNEEDVEPVQLELRRARLGEVKDVVAFIVRPGIGYVRLARFGPEIASDFALALAELKRQGMRQLVLDLRSSPGGLLNQAVSILDLLVPEDRPLVSTRGRITSSNATYYSTNLAEKWTDGPVVVLTDRWTASGAEAVAGALQDQDRALLAGSISLGMGTVTNSAKVAGGRLLATVATIQLPSGRNIQTEYSRFYERADRVEECARADVPSPAALAALPQFKSAAGRVIRGGGGICPDVHLPPVPRGTRFQREMQARQVFAQFAATYLGWHSGDEKPPALGPDFDLTSEEWEGLRAITAAKQLTVPDSAWNADRAFMLRQIRTELAGFKSGAEGRLQVSIEDDPQVHAAFDLLPKAAELLRAPGKSGSSRGSER